MNKDIRVLVLFGSSFLYGSEKANIDVFSSLEKNKEFSSLFLIDGKRSGELISSYLEKRNLEYTSVNYHFMFNKNMSVKQWIIKIYEILSGSFMFLYHFFKYKPTHIYTSKQEYFLNFLPALFFIKKPIIYRIGDSPVIHNFIYKSLWFYITKKVKLFVCVSKFIENQVKNYVQDNKTKVIYSRPHDGIKLIKNNKNNNSFNVLYIGQIGLHKGVDLLIQSAIYLCKKYDDISFYIAGKIDVKDSFHSSLINEVYSKKLSKRIHFLGFVNNVNELYKKSHLHVCPSVYEEPLANVLIDAKQNAITSIIFNVGGLPEVINNNHDGVICSNKNELSLRSEIEKRYLNKEQTKKMGLNAQKSLKILGVDKFSSSWFDFFINTLK